MIPWNYCEEGARLCKDNANRLIDAADAILQVQYNTPHAIPTAYATAMKYSSCCGLVILAIEEIGKGFFLLENFQNKQNVTDADWNNYTRRNAHQNKIRKAQGLLGPTNGRQIRELNRIKLRDVYVDWENGWQSPLNIQQANLTQMSTNLLELARLLLREFEQRF